MDNLILCFVGLFGVFISTIVGISFFKGVFFVYLTNWCMFTHAAIFILFIAGRQNSELTRKLLIVGWTIGWMVTAMFWGYIFPIVERSKLPPIWVSILSHGGIHLVVVYLFLRSSITVLKKDFMWPVVFCFTYLMLFILPLKMFAGVIVYPLFFDQFIPTIAIFIGSFVTAGLGFFSGYYILVSKPKKIKA